jgi:ribose-phosphate pyrophosphokinase
MELLVMIDALKRASAREITAVVPYYGYARQDRKVAPRTPISAKLVADLFVAAGATRMVSMDLHAGQIQGFFNIPFDNLFASPVILEHLKKIPFYEEFVIVSPDTGGLERARQLAERLGASVAVIDKRRIGPNMAQAMNVVGEVSQKNIVILDDMIDTAGTLVQAAQAVLNQGARKVFAAATHGVLSGLAIKQIEASQIEKVIVTDTLELPEQARTCSKIVQLSVSELLAEAIHRIQHHDSVSSLFSK